MSGPLQNASLFLITAIFDLYTFVLLVRLILALVRANYFNPMTQFFIRLTQPVIGPLRRVIPNFKNLELSTLFLVILLEFIKFFLIALLLEKEPNIAGLFLLASADLLRTLINLFFYAILIQAVLSWVQRGYSPVGELLAKITAPIIRPLHRIIPPIGGMDLSPVAAMIFLQLVIILVTGPLFAMGQAMTFG